MRRIKERITHVWTSISDYLLKVIAEVHLAIIWPKWFYIVTFIGMPLMAVEIVGTWFGFVWPAVGLFVYLYKKNL